MPLPGYQCKQALYDAELRAAIVAIAACFPNATDVQDIADELAVCTPLFVIQDIYIRLLTAVLCYIASGADIDCHRPDACDCYTVDALATSGSIDLWYPFLKCATYPDVTLINGHLTTSPTGIYNVRAGNMPFFTSLSFPQVATINGYVFIAFMEAFISFSAPLLTTVTGDFQIGSNNAQTTIEIPSITTVGGDFITSGTVETELLVPLLTTVSGDLISIGGQALADVDISSLTNFVGDFECVNAALTQASVNHILEILDGQVVLTGAYDVLLDSGTSAAPSGAGITAKNNLIGRGVNVVTN